VAQLTLYLPDDLAQLLRHDAQRAHKPLSAYLLELIEVHARPQPWPAEFVALLTTGEPGSLEVPDDPPPGDDPSL